MPLITSESEKQDFVYAAFLQKLYSITIKLPFRFFPVQSLRIAVCLLTLTSLFLSVAGLMADEYLPVITNSQSLVELQRKYLEAKSKDDNLALANLAVQAQELFANTNSSLEQRAGCLSLAAHISYTSAIKTEDYQTPLRMFKQVSEMEVSDFRRLDALRMILQIKTLFASDPEDAVETYKKMGGILNNTTDSSISELKSHYVFDTHSKGALALSKLGKIEQSIEARETIIKSTNLVFGSNELAQTYLELARDSQRMGNTTKALGYYDQLLERYSNFCVEGGSGPLFEIERVDVMQLQGGALIKQLEKIWNDSKYKKTPTILIVGKRLNTEYHNNKDSNEEVMLNQIISRIENEFASTNFIKSDFLDVGSLLEHTYFALGEHYIIKKEYQRAKNLFELFEVKFPNSILLPSVENQMRRLDLELKVAKTAQRRPIILTVFGIMVLFGPLLAFTSWWRMRRLRL
jgi:tetratricopeptide (TPR) repeat protein